MAVTPQPGDVVLAANEETGEVAYKEVVRTFVNNTGEITHVTILSTEHKGENMLKCKYTTFSNCGQLFILITRGRSVPRANADSTPHPLYTPQQD